MIDDYPNDIHADQSIPPFKDSISSLEWSPYCNKIFATTTWNGEVRIFEVVQQPYGSYISQRFSNSFQKAILKCCWNKLGNILFIGLIDGSIKGIDLNTGQIGDLCNHGSSISSLNYDSQRSVIISSGYDPIIKIWQMRNPTPIMHINAENKVYTADVQFPLIAAGTANERIMIADLSGTNTRTVLDSSELGKHSKIQSISLNPKATTMAVSSIDGRASISKITRNISGNYSTKSSITFKSNKQEQKGNTILYPVNVVSFHPTSERWFMTAGSDGVMHLWDFESKSKIKSLNYGGIPICTARVNFSGNMIAYALGNDWHIGAQGKWDTKIGVHVITDNEMKTQK